MFGFGSLQKPKQERAELEDILARHNANLLAEHKAPQRADLPPPPLVLKRKIGFGKRTAWD